MVEILPKHALHRIDEMGLVSKRLTVNRITKEVQGVSS